MPRWDKKREHLETVMCDVSRPEIATVELDGRALSPKIFLRVPKLRNPFLKKSDFKLHQLGGLFGKKTFYWLLQSKEKPQVMVVYDIVYGGFWKLISLSSLRKCIFWCSLFCVTAVSNCDLDCWAKDHKTFGPVVKGLPRTVAKDFGPQ